MILYATKQTIKELNIPMPQELSTVNCVLATNVINKEKNDRLLEWGLKLFYFDNRKCIQAMNFASKLTIFIFDIVEEQIAYIGDAIARYLLDIYEDDKEMRKMLEKLFRSHHTCAFSELHDRCIISSLNSNQIYFAEDGYRFYDYIENGILKTREINKKANWDNILSIKLNGKTEYIYPAKYFRKLLLGKE